MIWLRTWGRAYKTDVQPVQVLQNRQDPNDFLMSVVANYVFTCFYLQQIGDERSHIFQTPTPLLLHALRLLLRMRLRKILKHQLRLLLTL